MSILNCWFCSLFLSISKDNILHVETSQYLLPVDENEHVDCWLFVSKDDILHVETSQPSGRWFSFAPSTKSSFGPSDPMLADPFEERLVNVAMAF